MWLWFGGDDSYFEVKSQLSYTPDNASSSTKIDLKDSGTDMDSLNGRDLKAKGSIGGDIIINSDVEIEQDNTMSNPKQTSNFNTSFTYSVLNNGEVIFNNNRSNPLVEQHNLSKIKDCNDKPIYNAFKNMQNSTNKFIENRVSLQTVETIHNDNDSDKDVDYDASHYEYGLDGFKVGLGGKVELKLGIDGNDVLLFLGGTKVAKGLLGKLLKKSPALKEILDGAGDFLKKQSFSIEITGEMAGEIFANFKETTGSYNISTKESKAIRSYTSGGRVGSAVDINRIKIIQDLSNSMNSYYGKEDQSILTDEEKQRIDDFVTQNSNLVRLVKQPNSEHKIYLKGYASSSGEIVYNDKLSEKRLIKVRMYLCHKHGFDPKKHFGYPQSLGESQANQFFIDPVDRRTSIEIK